MQQQPTGNTGHPPEQSDHFRAAQTSFDESDQKVPSRNISKYGRKR
jgi:hypothetical protein